MPCRQPIDSRFFFDECDELQQRADVEPRMVRKPEPGARLLRHPHGNVDALAAQALQGVGSRWPLAAFSHPKTLASEGMEAVVDPDASITRSLL